MLALPTTITPWLTLLRRISSVLLCLILRLTYYHGAYIPADIDHLHNQYPAAGYLSTVYLLWDA